MDPSPVWYNVPIIREQTNKTKRVRWSDTLTQVKTISPRYKADPFSWPGQKSCNHFVCTAGQPCQMFPRFSVSQDPGLAHNNNNNQVNTASFNCSPQLKKVVIKAVNNSNSNNNNYYYGKPDKKDLSLNLGNNYSSYWSNSTSV